MNLKLEYEKDFYQWIEYHIALLKVGKLEEVDVDHLIEELESMGDRDKRELVNHFRILITHLLKWQYQYRQLKDLWETFTGGSWRGSIKEHRKRIAQQLKQSPSLKRYLEESVQVAYPDAVDIASTETQLPPSTFPNECPYTLEQLLDEDFLPEAF